MKNGSSTAPGGALVTGAGRGLGLEIARSLAARGYAVHVTDINGQAAQDAALQLGEPAWSSQLDVTDGEACRVAARETARPSTDREFDGNTYCQAQLRPARGYLRDSANGR